MLVHQAHIMPQRLFQGGEAKQVAQQLQEVSLLQGSETAFVGLPTARFAGKLVHLAVADNGLGGEGRVEHQPFQRLATAQCHIRLPVGKRAACVDDGMFKGEPLALVNGDGPRSLHRKLAEGAFHLFLDFLGSLVQHILGIGPYLFLQHDRLTATLRTHHHATAGHFGHLTQQAVVIAVGSRRIVFHKHHLRALLQHEYLVGGIGIFRELALHLGAEGEGTAGQVLQLALVDALRLVVVRHQADVTVFAAGAETGHVAAVQAGQRLVVATILAHPVQQVEEGRVLLAIHGGQLDGAILRLPQGAAGEEVGRVVVTLQQQPLLILHHGGQLLQVAYHEQLHAAEGLRAVAVAAQHLVDGIEQVGPHHADFVDDQEVHTADNVDFLPAETVAVGHLPVGGEKCIGHMRGKG